MSTNSHQLGSHHLEFRLDSMTTTSGLNHWHTGPNPSSFQLWDLTDYRPSTTEFIWDTLAFCGIYFLISTISQLLHEHYFPWFRKFSNSEKYQWNSRVISTIHASLASYLCAIHIVDSYYTGIYATWLQRLFISHNYLHFVVLHTTGYMIHDTVGILMDHSTEKLMFVHHFSFILASYLFKFTGFGYHYLMFPLMTEITTPFLNARYFMAVKGYKGFWYKVNVAILWVLWMIVRVSWAMLYLGYLVILDFFQVPSHLRSSDHFFWSYIGLACGLSIVFLINGVWGYILTTRIYAVLTRPSPSPSSTTTPNNTNVKIKQLKHE